MSLLLSCDAVSKSFGARLLFRGITLGLFEGERTGLIGPNGAGKSTLLKIITNLEHADEGDVLPRRGLRMGYVAQEDTFDDAATIEQVMLETLAGEHLEEHEAQTRVAIQLGKMGFEDPGRVVGALSGGGRKRLAIARELVKGPDLLLMDEPTNHLDVDGILWLEKLLTGGRLGVLMVSHDRYFLENVTNRTIELSQAFPEGFLSINGTYSDFLVKKEEFLAAQASQERAVAGRVRREIEWLKRGAKARTTKAKGRIQEAGRLMGELGELKVRNAQAQAVKVDFAGTDRRTKKLLEAKGVSKTLGGRTLFSKLSFVLSPGMCLGLLGPNGSGKTTLIRLMTGEMEPDAGEVKRADALRVVYFQQGREELDKAWTLRHALSPMGESLMFQGQSIHVSGWAKRFLFRTEQLDMPVGDLSGGEQARVLIARMMLQPADLLILDEPTNDLDIPSLEVLEESLEDFPGALVLVTHDRFMLDRLSTEILALDGDGGAQPYADVAQWQQSRDRAREQAAADKKPAPRPAAAAAPEGEKKRPAAGLKRLTWNEQREWEQMEAKIVVAEAALETAQQEMADPAVMADHERMRGVCERVHVAQQAVEGLYARWAELEEKQK